MSEEQKGKGQTIVEIAITVSALFMVLIGLLLYFYHEGLGLDKETAKILVIFCVGFAIFEIVVIKKLFIRAMSK